MLTACAIRDVCSVHGVTQILGSIKDDAVLPQDSGPVAPRLLGYHNDVVHEILTARTIQAQRLKPQESSAEMIQGAVH